MDDVITQWYCEKGCGAILDKMKAAMHTCRGRDDNDPIRERIAAPPAPKAITVNDESFVPRAEFMTLLEMVSKMREAQQKYFKDREKESLIAAKGYEGQVDRIIKIYEP